MQQARTVPSGVVEHNSCLAAAIGAYREWTASGPIADHVACLWTHALPCSAIPALQVIPDGCVDIIWAEGSLRVAGPDTGPITECFAPGTKIVGLRFRPGAAPPWLGVPALEIVNRRVPLQEFWGTDARRLADRLSETVEPVDAAAVMLSALCARQPRAGLTDRAAPTILAAIRRDDGASARIPALANDLGLSERTLRRRCENAFGYGPKTLERILRFQRFLKLLRRPAAPGLAQLAMESGFADQAHLTREVRSLGGATPAAFMRQLAA